MKARRSDCCLMLTNRNESIEYVSGIVVSEESVRSRMAAQLRRKEEIGEADYII